MLQALVERLDSVTDWQAESIQSELQTLVKERELGFAKLAQPIRIAVDGRCKFAINRPDARSAWQERKLATLARSGRSFFHLGRRHPKQKTPKLTVDFCANTPR